MKIQKFPIDGPDVEMIQEDCYVGVEDEKMYVLYKQGARLYDVEVNAEKVGVMDKSGHIYLENEMKNQGRGTNKKLNRKSKKRSKRKLN